MDNEELKRQGIAYYRQNNYEMALEKFLACTISLNEDNEFSFYLGQTYAKLQNTEKAVELLKQVFENSNVEIFVNQSAFALSYIYVLKGQFDEADHLLANLDKKGIAEASFYALWGYVAEQKNEGIDAIRRYKMALNIDPENTNALNSLGYLYANMNKSLDEALIYCRRAVSLKPDNASYLDSLGLVCLKLFKIKEALDYFERANQLNPQDETIAQHLKKAQSIITKPV